MPDDPEIDRIQLLCDLHQGKAMCNIAASLLDDLGEGELHGAGLTPEDLRFGLAGIIRSIARTLSSAESFIGNME
jgi:hypothetical protein